MKIVLALLGAVASAFIIAPSAQAQPSYLVRPGDVLRIEVLEDPGLNRSVIVAPDGRISMPLAGVVGVSGRPLEAVQSELIQRMAGNFAGAPNVFVSLERLAEQRPGNGTGAPATIGVFVMGEGAKNGRIDLKSGTTILQAFSQMGGFSKFAATKRIQLRRADRKSGTEKIYTFNYDAMVSGDVRSGMTQLVDGDVILVPQRRLFE
jgi:polysaccharide biosynthesis/export protein